MAQTSQAYDLERFEKKQAKVIPLKVDQQKALKQKKRLRFQKLLNMAVTAAVGLGIVAVVALMIVSKVQLTEMNNRISQKQQQIADVAGETERLKGELAGYTSAESVEQYIKDHHMQKADADQNIYVSVDTEDVIEVTEQQTKGFFERIWASIVQLFS